MNLTKLIKYGKICRVGRKDEAHSLIDRMPADATWDDLMREIYIRETIKRGLADIDNLPEPDVLAEEIIENLETGVERFKQIMESINGR